MDIRNAVFRIMGVHAGTLSRGIVVFRPLDPSGTPRLGFIETRELDESDEDADGNPPEGRPQKTKPREYDDILNDVKAYQAFQGTCVDGYYFNRVDTTDSATTDEILQIAELAKGQGVCGEGDHKAKRIVFGTGIALNNPKVARFKLDFAAHSL